MQQILFYFYISIQKKSNSTITSILKVSIKTFELNEQKQKVLFEKFFFNNC